MVVFSNPFTYDDGAFIGNVSRFPLWAAGMVDDLRAPFIIIDAGSWSTPLEVAGIDLSMVAMILAVARGTRALAISALEELRDIDFAMTAILTALQALAAGISDETVPAIAALIPVTKMLLATQQLLALIVDASVRQNLEINYALLLRAYRLLQLAVAVQA